MIDTLIIRIHNLRQYTKLIETIRNSSCNEGVILNQIVDPSGIDFKQNYLQIVENIYTDNEDKRNVRMRDKVYLPSSHYKLSWLADARKDFLEFNFSVPKLIYGTNVIQFIKHFDEYQDNEFFDYSRQQGWAKNMTDTYKRLIKFIKLFLDMRCTWEETTIEGKSLFKTVDLKDVEINRVDLCYNQLFETKEKALDYLELQKLIRKKGLREDTINNKAWKTSVWVQTTNYVAKIYHKGSEYAVGDRKEHERINRYNKAEIFNVDKLQDISDRTLRYEISFKSNYMSYIFKHKLFRKDCKFHNELKKYHKEVHSNNEKLKRIQEKIIKLEYRKSRLNTIEKHRIEILKKKIKEEQAKAVKLTKANKEYVIVKNRTKYAGNWEILEPKWMVARIYENLTSQVSHFFLSATATDRLDNQKTIRFGYKNHKVTCVKNALFSSSLLNEMLKIFKRFFKEYQIEVRRDFKSVEIMIEDWNNAAKIYNDEFKESIKAGVDKRKTLINVNSFKKIYELSKNNSWDMLIRKGLISKRSKYRYIKQFEELGIDKNQFAVIPVEACKDFSDYHAYLFSNPDIKVPNVYFH